MMVRSKALAIGVRETKVVDDLKKSGNQTIVELVRADEAMFIYMCTM